MRTFKAIITTIQKLLIIVLLAILYFLGFGITAALMAIFRRKSFTLHSRYCDTFWIDAKDCEFVAEEASRQS
ncbi:MAG: hypothetical protein PHE18_05660 [Candidatus Omnitrophica bacterium]|nr:hypothetical protein [Candidatus Omnitrophota bacterium]MDD5553343.1 hypothetical protein [Candidatus Omnitrophota bacterium]